MNLTMRPELGRIAALFSKSEIADLFANPVFIISAPRSGSTLLFHLLSQSPDIWTIGSESHRIYMQFPNLPSPKNASGSGRLFARHADDATAERMRLIYLALLQDHAGAPLSEALEKGRVSKFVFLEKTPRNALNIEFLLRVFPKARFIFLHRDPRENISSLMEGWKVGAETGQFVTSRTLPDWPLGIWCFLLPPGWEALKGKEVSQIAAFQWRACNDIIMDDLEKLPRERWTDISYRALVDDPSAELSRLCAFCGADPGEFLSGRTAENLPLSRSTISAPSKDKWRRHENEIMAVLPSVDETVERIAKLERQSLG